MSTQGRPARLLNGAILVLSSAIGVVAFVYPFVQPAAAAGAFQGGAAHAQDAALVFGLLVALSLGAVLGNLVGGGLNAKIVAALGVLTAVNAVLRAVPGPVGFSAIHALPILAGYCYGPMFGYLLGALSVGVSALLGAGVGPWLPYQMLAVGWVGLTSGWLPALRRRPRLEVGALAAWGIVWGMAFGLIMNLWFWPYIYDPTQAGLYWEPGTGALAILKRYLSFYVVTSLWWDLGRAAGNVTLILLFGAPVLRLLRRFRRRFTFHLHV
ncbi:MAG: ECF transporter S component [Anaerolineae bacterium]|nr:ECF transporter S component [Anaerolineae bacterium]